MESHDPIPNMLMQKIRVMSECDEVREIPGYPLYAITVTGQVWSVKPRGVQRDLPKIPRKVKLGFWKGFDNVKLQDEKGAQHTHSVGRLLLMTFVSSPPFEEANASFIDGNTKNFALSNLEWITNSDRAKHAVERHGGAFAYGEALGQSKLTVEDISAMKSEYKSGLTFQQIAEKHGVTRRTAARAIRGTAWKQVGGGIDPVITNHVRGVDVKLAKLNPDKVRQVRQMLNDGMSLSAVGREMGLAVSTVAQIRDGKTWKHVS